VGEQVDGPFAQVGQKFACLVVEFHPIDAQFQSPPDA
jgi:hypothetical protein